MTDIIKWGFMEQLWTINSLSVVDFVLNNLSLEILCLILTIFGQNLNIFLQTEIFFKKSEVKRNMIYPFNIQFIMMMCEEEKLGMWV